jgi:hypothetical protein
VKLERDWTAEAGAAGSSFDLLTGSLRLGVKAVFIDESPRFHSICWFSLWQIFPGFPVILHSVCFKILPTQTTARISLRMANRDSNFFSAPGKRGRESV